MLRLSRRSDYGLVFLLTLASKNKKEPVSLNAISQEKKLPAKFVAKLALSLKNAGIINSKEGVGGGYFLNKSPYEITLLEILEALEGPLFTTVCQVRLGECPIESVCPSKNSLLDVTDQIVLSLKKKTLADLLERRRNEQTR